MSFARLKELFEDEARRFPDLMERYVTALGEADPAEEERDHAPRAAGNGQTSIRRDGNVKLKHQHDRSQEPLYPLDSFTAAMRSCLLDIPAPGLLRTEANRPTP